MVRERLRLSHRYQGPLPASKIKQTIRLYWGDWRQALRVDACELIHTPATSLIALEALPMKRWD
jgi:hypothetical protein